MSKQFSMFIGRWQPWHPGHRWLIDQRLKIGKNVWVAIRDVEPNSSQPWTPQEVKLNLEKRKAKMEKIYEKMCGKKYQKEEIVDEEIVNGVEVEEVSLENG